MSAQPTPDAIAQAERDDQVRLLQDSVTAFAAGRLPLGAAAPRMEAAPGRLPHASLGRLPLGAGAPRLELAAAPDRPVGPAKLAPLS